MTLATEGYQALIIMLAGAVFVGGAAFALWKLGVFGGKGKK